MDMKEKDLLGAVAELTNIFTVSMEKLLINHSADRKKDEETKFQNDKNIALRRAALKEEENKTININFSDIMRKMTSFKLPDDGVKYDTILCLSRGGLIPAGILAYNTGIKNIINVNISSYTDDNKQESVNLERLSNRDLKKLEKAKGVLIVDDIVDSGKTMEYLLKYLNKTLRTELSPKTTKLFAIANKLEGFGGYTLYDCVGDSRWVVFEWDK